MTSSHGVQDRIITLDFIPILFFAGVVVFVFLFSFHSMSTKQDEILLLVHLAWLLLQSFNNEPCIAWFLMVSCKFVLSIRFLRAVC
jgi:hypothetical protein